MAQEPCPGREPIRDRATGTVLLTHDVGLHARPSVTMTKLARKFTCRVEIGLSDEGPWVDAKSIAKIMKMRVPKDTVLHLQASGPDATEAVSALVLLVERDFETD